MTVDVDPSTPRPGGGRDRAVLMADVAALAGVSQMTVSRVVNDTAPVRASTRKRVVDAMRRLDYRPNAAARALATGRSCVVGVVALQSTLFGPASTLLAVEEAAREAGYHVSVAGLAEPDARSISRTVERLLAQGVDGLVVMTPHANAADALSGVASGAAVVAVQGGGGAGVASVTVDQHGGALQATRHLLALGHDTVHHVAGPRHWLEGAAREEAWREALVAAGRRVPTVRVGDWSARSGYEAGRALLAEERPTAVFVANDPMALGLYRAVREAGLRIPDDVSVVGFDDVPESAFFAPPLTTVRQDFDQVGARSLRVLLQQVEGGPRPPASTVVEATLVQRASTAPPRS